MKVDHIMPNDYINICIDNQSYRRIDSEEWYLINKWGDSQYCDEIIEELEKAYQEWLKEEKK